MKEFSYNKYPECNENVFAVKKENDYVFLTPQKFKFSEVKNYIGPGLSYDAWSKSMGCKLQKLMFPSELLDSHIGPVGYEDFYRSLKITTAKDEYEQFLKMLKLNTCTTISDRLRAVVLFIEAFRKMDEQYYSGNIDICNNAVSIPGISMMYALNMSLEKGKKLGLYSPGGICHACQDKLEQLQCCSLAL